MKRIYHSILVLVVAFLSAPLSHAEWSTTGNEQAYTLSQLASIAESGVELHDAAYWLVDDLTIAATDTLWLHAGETLLLGDDVLLTVNGVARFDAASTATLGRIDDDCEPQGINVVGDASWAVLSNVDMSHMNLRYSSPTSPLVMTHCTIHDGNKALTGSAGVVQLVTTVEGNLIEDCTFTGNASPAIGSAANYPLALTVKDSHFVDNNQSNANNPQINLAVGGDYDVIITGNTIEGTGRNMVGGIGMSNFMAYEGTGRVVVQDNVITECRYGIANVGPVPHFIIKDNVLRGNNHETNPMNGGSGISLYDPYRKTTAHIEGNHIEGSLWGITIIGCKDVNVGKLDADPASEDYNPGRNVFKDNGNGGVPYDLYNNSTLTVYAQGNTWSVAEQDAEHIETVVFHQADNASLGEVIYMPAAEQAGIDQIVAAPDAVRAVYTLQGAVLPTTDVTTLPAGIYVVVTTRGAFKVVK